MSIRIREPREKLNPGERITKFSWKNPPAPKPRPDPAQKFVREQERLNHDPRAFKSACEWNGL